MSQLPPGWRKAVLREAFTRTLGGGTPSTRHPEYWGGNIPWTTSANLNGLFLREGQKQITQLGLADSASHTVPAGNLLIATRVGVGKSAVNLIDIAISQDLTGCIVDGERFDPLFLALLLRTPHCQQFFELRKRGATIQGIPREDLLAMEIIAPPLKEQRAVAAALSKIQEAAETQGRIVERLKELKAATMGTLLHEGLRQERTIESEIGRTPASWRVSTLGAIAAIGNGSTPRRTNPAYWEGGTIPWLTSGKVHETIIRKADEFVTELAKKECHLPMVPAGSVLIAITGQGKTLGNAALLTSPSCVSQHLAFLRLQSPDVIPEFVLGYLQHRYRHLRQAASSGGSTKGALTCSFLENYPIPLPDIREQQEIAAALQALDSAWSRENAKRNLLEALFFSTLNQLMTGHLRAHGA